MLIVGNNKIDAILQHLPGTFLIADYGPIIDRILEQLPSFLKRPKPVVEIDFNRDSLNPFDGMSYELALRYVDILDGAFPAGGTTLTKENGLFRFLERFLSTPTPKRFDRLFPPLSKTEKDTGVLWASQKTRTLMLSPVLKRFLCNPSRHTNFTLDGTILLRLSRTMPRRDRYILTNFIAAQYNGHVVLPDYAIYASPWHVSLIDEERLIAGLNFLDEVSPYMKNQLLRLTPRFASGANAHDAAEIARHNGLIPDPLRDDSEFNNFVRAAVS